MKAVCKVLTVMWGVFVFALPDMTGGGIVFILMEAFAMLMTGVFGYFSFTEQERREFSDKTQENEKEHSV